ncbi:zinc finger, CCHC-type containing protein [Tanacetum coccineum]|uniref:Zinc finger, CCHC-type containing protein n=1 Tax=Tanacetum coccineum TaxID=301880 RepID=A0ABQ5GMY5_9ASTR
MSEYNQPPLIELGKSKSSLVEAILAPTQPTKLLNHMIITTSCEICSGPHDTQYCMEDPEQAFVEYASSRTDEARTILKKKITNKEDVRGNFKILCSIGGLKHVNALVDQGSDVNVMPYSTHMKLTDKMPAETDIRLSLASHSYIYLFGITEYILVDVVEHVYPVDFVILDIKENKRRPFILGTPFLTMAKAAVKFDKGTITLRSGKSKISFHRIPDSPCMTEKGVKNDIEPIAPTITVNMLVLEWEEKIKLRLEREMEFNQWRSKKFKGKHPTLITTKGGMDDEGEVTLHLMRRSLEVLRKFHWTILG